MNNDSNNYNKDNELEIKKDNKKKTLTGNEILKTFAKYFLLGIVVVAIFTSGYLTHYLSMDSELQSVNFLLNVYQNHYYQAQDKSKTDLIVDALMDEYSEFYTKEEYQKVIQSGNGNREGYGFAFKNLIFSQVVWNSPAENAGVRVGDIIKGYKVVGQAEYITATTDDAFEAFVQGVKSSETVELLIERETQSFSVQMKKSNYVETYVRYTDNTGSYAFLGEGDNIAFEKVSDSNVDLSDGWAYLQFSRFYGRKEDLAGGAGQFKRALEEFVANGNEKLIIDIRSNGGGYMEILCKVATHLCYDGESDGQSLVCQKAIYNDGKEEVFKTEATDYLEYKFKKIVFLANSGSASASEALMGAVLDYDKKSGNNIVNVVLEPSVINGKTVYKTYGKGIMQSTISNSFTGEAVKLTTAQIYWPIYGHSIHGVGLTPETDSRVLATQGDAIAFAQTL